MQTTVFQDVTLITERGQQILVVIKPAVRKGSFISHLLRNLVLTLVKQKHLNRWTRALHSYMTCQILEEKC